MRTTTGVAHETVASVSDPLPDTAMPVWLSAVRHRQLPACEELTGDPGASALPLPAVMLTTVLMHLPCGVIVVDNNRRVVFMNEAGKDLSAEITLATGLSAGGVLPGAVGGSQSFAFDSRLTGALAGDAVPDVDYVLGAVGEARHRVIQVAITPLRDATARILGAVLTVTDLTERVDVQATLVRATAALAKITRETLAREAGALARKALAQAQDNRDLTQSNTNLEHQATLTRVAKDLAEAMRETLAREASALAETAITQSQNNRDLTRSNAGLENFASVASHDLQEPLRKIQAFGDRLKTVDGDALSLIGADCLQRMQQAAARMQVLINDLLAFARVSAGPPSVSPVDLAAVARAVLTDLELQVAQCGGRVEVGTLPIIAGDPLRLRQLLQNLISNALKFRRPEVAPVVMISGVLLPRENSEEAHPDFDASPLAWLRLTVQDNGIGFEQKYAEGIFEVFKRLHGRGAYEGTGIGLALCRRIAEQHGGHITATSAPGQGATLRVTLPLYQPQGVGTL